MTSFLARRRKNRGNKYVHTRSHLASSLPDRSVRGEKIPNPFFLANTFKKSFNIVHEHPGPSAWPECTADAKYWTRRPFGADFPAREATLRISKHKIEYLSDKILRMLQEHPRIHVDDNTDLVTRAIDDAIFENMKQEEEIDAQVEALVAQNKNEIRAMEMDVGALRSQMKRELAKKNGFIL